MDAYLEEELYDLLTFCIQNPQSREVTSKKDRVQEIGRELCADGGVDALENMFFSIEHRVREEIGRGKVLSFLVEWHFRRVEILIYFLVFTSTNAATAPIMPPSTNST